MDSILIHAIESLNISGWKERISPTVEHESDSETHVGGWKN